MGTITRVGQYSQKPYNIKIAGDSPTADEALRIDAFLRQSEAQYADRATGYGLDVTGGQGSGFSNQVGEVFKGIPAGAINVLESAGLGISALLPEETELKAREAIRRTAIGARSPFAPDIGLEDSAGSMLGQGLGSFGAFAGTYAIPFVGAPLAAGLAVASGAGEASERARASGATDAERNQAALLGGAVGATELIPVSMLFRSVGGPAGKGILNYIRRALVEGGVEGAQEAAAETMQNLIEQGIYNPEQGTFEGVVPAAGTGFSVGAIVQGLVDLVVRERGPQAPSIEAPDQPAALPPPDAPTIAPPTARAPQGLFEEGNPQGQLNLDGVVPEVTEEQLNLFPSLPEQQAPTVAQKTAGGVAATLSEPQADPAEALATKYGLSTNDVFSVFNDIESAVAKETAPEVAVPVVAERLGVTPEAVQDIYNTIRKYALDEETSAQPEVQAQETPAEATPQSQEVEADTAAAPVAPASPAGEVTAAEGRAATGIAEIAPEPTTPAAPERPVVAPTMEDEVTSIREDVEDITDAATAEPDAGLITVSKLAAMGIPPQAAVSQAARSGTASQETLRKKLEAFVRANKRNPDAVAAARAFLDGPVAGPADAGAGGAGAGGDTAGVGQRRVGPDGGGDTAGAGGRVPRNVDVSGERAGAPAPTTQRVPASLERNAMPGQTTGTARQNIPPGIPPEPTRARGPEAERVEAAAPTVEQVSAENDANQRATSEYAMARANLMPKPVRDFARSVDEEIGEIADVTTSADKNKLVALWSRPRPTAWEMSRPQPNRTKALSPMEWAAGRYFLRNQNPMHALELIAHDAVYGNTETAGADTIVQDLKDSTSKSKTAARRLMGQKYKAPDGADPNSPVVQYNAFTGRKYARPAVDWVRNNMSPAAVQYLDQALAKHHRDMAREASRYTQKDTVAEKRENAKREVRVARESLADMAARYELETAGNRKPKVSLPPMPEALASLATGSADVDLMMPLHPAVVALLQKGDLKNALYTLSISSRNKHVRRLAAALTEFTGNTKVYVVPPVEVYEQFAGWEGAYLQLTEAQRREAEAINSSALDYDDSIILHPDRLSAWLLLHEATHMATNRVLDNKNHPVTRRITQLFNEMRPTIEGLYGNTNIYEFVAEAMSDPYFRSLLDSYIPKGQSRTGLQRFGDAVLDFIRSLFGLGPRTNFAETALSEMDSMVYSIMAPAPEFAMPGRSAQARTRRGAEDLIKGVVDRVVPFEAKQARQTAAMLLSDNIPDTPKRAALGLIPLRNLADMGSGVFGKPLMERLVDIANGLSARLRSIHEYIDHTLQDTAKWVKANEDLLPEFNWLQFTATLNEVDPGKPRSTYKSDPEKLATWDEMQPVWNKIKRTGGDKEFYRMGGLFRRMRQEAAEALEARIRSYTQNTDQSRAIYRELYDKVLAKNLIDPYVPLMRSGRYWLEYSAVDPVTKRLEYYKESFESMADRRAAEARVRKYIEESGTTMGDVKTYTGTRDGFDRAAPSGPFVRDLMDTLRTNGVDEAAQTEVLDLILDMIPERSFLNSFRARKGTRGFRGDVTPSNFGASNKFDPVRHVHQRASSMARQIARMRYGADAQAFRADLAEVYRQVDANSPANTDYITQLFNELDTRAKGITGMNRAQWSRSLTGGLFFMTLGFNMSSAMVNMFALPTIVAGYLGGKYGLMKTAKAMGKATKIIAASGRERTIEKVDAQGNIYEERAVTGIVDYSFDNYDFNDPRNAKIAHLKYLAEAAKQGNQLHRSLVFEMADIDETTSTAGLGTQWEKVRALSGSIFHHSERYARETTLLAAYEMELNKRLNGRDPSNVSTEEMARIGPEAAREAVYAAEMTNGSVAATAAPRWAQGNVGAVFFLFKRYMLSMLSLQVTLANRAFRGMDAETRKTAKLQLAQIYGLLGLFSGVAGVPLYGMLADLWNLFLTDDDEEDFETMTRTALGELGYKGVVNYLSGREVASRIGLNDMLFRESLQELPLWADIVAGFGGPAIGVLANTERGVSKIMQGEVWRGVEDISPTFVRSLMRAGRYGVQGEATTQRGDAIVEDLGLGDALGQALGFAPAEYVYQLDMNTQYKRMDKAIAEKRTQLTRSLYIALRERNFAEARKVREEIAEFNRTHPQYPIKAENIKRSLEQHNETSRTMVGGVQYNPQNRDMFNRMMREWSSPTIWG